MKYPRVSSEEGMQEPNKRGREDKEERLLVIRTKNQTPDPIVFQYYSESSHVNSKDRYSLNSEMTIHGAKEKMSNARWFCVDLLPPVCFKLFSSDKRATGSLNVQDKLGKYLDGNETCLYVEFIELQLPGKAKK